MANHCENSLQVWGDDAATVAKFRTAVAGKSSDLELDNYPPLLVDESTDRELYEDWIMTWGMKYEAESTVIDENATYLHYYFNSWGFASNHLVDAHLPRVPDVALRASLSGAELALYGSRDGKRWETTR